MNYELLHEDENTYHLKDPKGKKIKIAKQAISDALHEKIRGFSKGGVAGEDGEVPEALAKPEDYIATQALTVDPSQMYTGPTEQDKFQQRVKEESMIRKSVADQVGYGAENAEPDKVAADLLKSKIYQDKLAAEAAQKKEAEKQKLPGLYQQAGFQPPGTNIQSGPTQLTPGAGLQTPGQDQTEPGQVVTGEVSTKKGMTGNALEQAIAAQKSATMNIGKAESDYNKNVARAEEANQVQEQQNFTNYQLSKQALDLKHQQLFQAVMESKIDPNRLWNNAGTGAKISAGIGMILGGMGAGLTGGPNQALEVIKHSMDKDLEAQKIDLGKKQTLLSENLAQYKNLNDAFAATRLQQATMLKSKLMQMAAQSGSAIAMERAKAASAVIDINAAPIQQQLLMNTAKAQSIGALSRDGQGGIPVGQEPPALLLDKDYAQKRVIVNGRAYQHTGSEKEASEMRTFESKAGPIISAVNRLGELGKSAVIPGSAAALEAQALRAQLSTDIAGLKSTEIGSSRINHEESMSALDSIKNPTKFSEMLNGDIKNEAFFKHLQETTESLRNQGLLGYKGMMSVPGRQGGGWKRK